MESEDLVSITGGPLKPHEYVLVKAEMTAGDEAWIQNHAAVQRGKTKEDIEIVFQIGEVKLATAKRLVKGWSLSKEVTQPDGTKISIPILYNPKNPGNIEQLPNRIYKYILKRIDELNPDEDEDEGGGEDKATGDGFLLGAVDSSEDNWEAERVFRLKH